MDPSQVLTKAIKAVALQLDGDDLAWLALTGKIELHFRDLIGSSINRHNKDFIVAREWNRRDLALLTPDCEPIAIIEGKAHYTFDYMSDIKLTQDYPREIIEDVEKIQEHPSALPFIMITSTHVATHVPSRFENTVKYMGEVNSALKKYGPNLFDEAMLRLRNLVQNHGTIILDETISTGTALGLEVSVHSMLLEV